MTAARWHRLVATLADAGIEARLDEKPYSEMAYGRVKFGTSRSVVILTDDVLVSVMDVGWRKNPDVWIGYQVTVEDRADSIIRKTWPLTKKRSEVVAAVREALS